MDTLNYIKMLDSFSNACIAYKILLIVMGRSDATINFLK